MLEEALIFDRVPESESKAIRGSLLLAEMAALSLHQDGARVFPDADSLLDALDDNEADHVTESVYVRLCQVAPTSRRSNYGMWRDALRNGAMDASNALLAESLATSVRGELGRAAIPCPERFFDVPRHRLTEGQWWAYRAARWACVERHDKRQ